MTDWTEKYRPDTLSAVRGNDSARDDLAEWAETWPEHREAVIVHGSPGVGKTSAAHALAADKGWDVVELNASDDRTADVIERVAGEAAQSGTLTRGGDDRKLVILDEADSFHGNADYGGAAAVTDLVKEAEQPVVLLANDYYEMTRGLRSACQEIEFRDVSPRSIVPVLRDICRREGIEFEEAALEALAERDSGDLRSAINDLQAAAEDAETLTEDDVVTGQRDDTADIFTFLDAVLKEADAQTALETSYDVDETPDSLLQWVEDKAPTVYEEGELAAAYRFMAAADRWLGRVQATQNYTYWRYANAALSAGVASVRERDRGGWTQYGGAPYRSSADQTRDDVARSVAAREGTSIATARREIVPFLSAMTHHCRNRELTVAMAARYDLGAEEVAFVTGSGVDTNKVESIVADATERRQAATEEHGGAIFDVPDESAGADTPREAGADESADDETGGESGDGDGGGDADEAQSGLSEFT